MRRFFILLIVLTFFAFPFQAKAYLSEEWTKECGYVSFTEGAFFLRGLRLYSQANWREIFGYIGKEVCVEGFLEKKQGKNIGISYHLISEVELHAAAKVETEEVDIEPSEEPVEIVPKVETPRPQTYYGFLKPASRNKTHLQLDNGQNVLLIKIAWTDDLAGPKFFVEGKALIRDGAIRSIKNPMIYSYEQYAQTYPPVRSEEGEVVNDLGYDDVDWESDDLDLTEEEINHLLEVLLEEIEGE